MVSTRVPKVMGSVEAKKESDVLPILEAFIKGQRIYKVYVNRGAQVLVDSFISFLSSHSLYSALPMLQFCSGLGKVRKPFKKSRRC